MKMVKIDQCSALNRGKDLQLFKSQYDELHLHSAVRVLFVGVISMKTFEFNPLNSEQIQHI